MGGTVSDWENFLGRPRLGRCWHRSTLTTLIAGLERIVCEDCGHVSVRFVAETVKLYPDLEEMTARLPGQKMPEGTGAGGKPPTCGDCAAPAVFITPRGLACPEHAWAAAARQDALGYELWIPIRIDQNANTSG